MLGVGGLPAGTYTLTETKAPAGYERTDKTFTVTIDAEHTAASFGQIVNEKTPASVVPPASPAPTAAPPASLALTGGGDGGGLALIAAALLVSGAVVTAGAAVRRRATGATASGR
ncbi:prealbumin-like fold domain-containing protein [Microbacterium sp. KUDC0406]|uniref:prealbumin-like fold domain-containing protein n=1 Tax=Microbacterium sp. KUDC0406 TaxID=2909588 RepID=UPI001F16E4D9|nr:prealbumin-like fold domain-containing protein [Microbacterium sp. KUDC0406]UJP09401.1 prealbumin-like fold domain-containing protein [Microbacterium sp. KUDC0406]